MTDNRRIAWITGAGSGIGAATARRLAQEGWIIAATSRRAEKIDHLCKEDPAFIKAYPGDVTNAEDIDKLVQKIETDLGPISMVILNAGIGRHEALKDFSLNHFKQVIDINVMGVANCLSPILTRFINRKSGHIAITASIAGYRGLPRALSYCASKAALNNLAESLAIETIGTNIKVQVINPGYIKTPMTDGHTFPMPMLMEVDEAAEKLVQGLKSNRFEIIFPWPFCLAIKSLKMLPYSLYFRLISWLNNKH
jgi:NAD(P)-dependent dehydrogenase (short-subunit alcohol dehydrogenase family)